MLKLESASSSTASTRRCSSWRRAVGSESSTARLASSCRNATPPSSRRTMPTEERVARRGGVNALGGTARAPCQCCNGSLGQRRKMRADRRCGREIAQRHTQRMVGRNFVITVCGNGQACRALNAAPGKAQQIQRGTVRPVHVFQHDSRRRAAFQLRLECVEHALAGGRAARASASLRVSRNGSRSSSCANERVRPPMPECASRPERLIAAGFDIVSHSHAASGVMVSAASQPTTTKPVQPNSNAQARVPLRPARIGARESENLRRGMRSVEIHGGQCVLTRQCGPVLCRRVATHGNTGVSQHQAYPSIGTGHESDWPGSACITCRFAACARA